ncbi:MAG: U32 family peptidase [Candidatus Omnitrophica bacterium]|nr:U32 family peptidase [Candidatus Omnitrophota bacterium]
MIKIVSPITNISEVDPLINAGASEFYCGVMTEQENKSLTNIYCLNRRPSLFSNLSSFKELEALVKKAKIRKVKVNFTLNEFYTADQFENVKDQVKKAIDCGIDAFIAADLGLIKELQKYKDRVKTHIGVGATTFNAYTAGFYKGMGAERIILPRQLTLDEIGDICSKEKGLEFECLILNERCHFIDGYCNFLHSAFSYQNPLLNLFKYDRFRNKIWQFLPAAISKMIHVHGMKKEVACCFNYKAETNSSPALSKNRSSLGNFFNAETFLNACGACSLQALDKAQISFVKIVGRTSFKNKVKDVEFIARCLKLLKEEIGAGFCNAVEDIYRQTYKNHCRKSYCYYPKE